VLGIHDKPSGVLEVDGYWQPMFDMLEKMQTEGFVRRPWRELLSVNENAGALLDQLAGPSKQPGEPANPALSKRQSTTRAKP
jgi:predicted Rossmann-fold nucleotide-binding protein